MSPQLKEDFAALVGTEQEDESIDLLRASLTIARTEYPRLDIEAYLNGVDALASRVRKQLRSQLDNIETLCAINGVLFEEERFRGNADDYYDPRNSFLNDVIDRKLGIPITLSVLYLEVARRVGVPLFGVGMPGHFLLKFYETDGREYFLDPYSGGQLLTRGDCQQRFDQIYGGEVSLQSGFLSTVSKRQILLRLLNNLRNIYMTRRTLRKAVDILDFVLVLYPRSADDLKQRALLRYQIGNAKGTVDDIEEYVRLSPDASDAEDMKETALSIRRSIAMMN